MTNFFIIWLIATKLAWVSPFIVDGASMEPNLHSGELFLIERKIEPGDLKRGDIVVFDFVDNYFYVKRVIGLPGETVRLKDNQVEIKSKNGDYKALDEPYLKDISHYYVDQRYFIVPDGEYFVMGDNREHSKDSRSFVYPYVKVSQIYGRYIFP